jgi:hypothetical protein
MTKTKIFISTLRGEGRAVEHEPELELLRKWTHDAYEIRREFGMGSGVDRARNAHVALARKWEADVFFSIDSGVVFRPGDAVQMIETGLEVVGAGYPRCELAWSSIAEAAEAGCPGELLREVATTLIVTLKTPFVVKTIGGGRYYEALSLGTAFLCIRMQAIERYIEAYREEIEYESNYPPFDETHHAVFMGEVKERRYLTEDYAFCRRYRALGPIWAYAGARVSRRGPMLFEGSLETQLLHRGEDGR